MVFVRPKVPEMWFTNAKIPPLSFKIKFSSSTSLSHTSHYIGQRIRVTLPLKTGLIFLGKTDVLPVFVARGTFQMRTQPISV